jgi:hypothetical protein
VLYQYVFFFSRKSKSHQLKAALFPPSYVNPKQLFTI